MIALRDYSDAALIEELARRQNERDKKSMPEHWCDDCRNFKVFAGKGEMPDNYNPCSKGHKISFRAPDDYGEEYGFYRRVCTDRAEPSP